MCDTTLLANRLLSSGGILILVLLGSVFDDLGANQLLLAELTVQVILDVLGHSFDTGCPSAPNSRRSVVQQGGSLRLCALIALQRLFRRELALVEFEFAVVGPVLLEGLDWLVQRVHDWLKLSTV